MGRSKVDVNQILQDNLDNIEEWTRKGLTMQQIANNLGISVKTLYRRKLSEKSPIGQAIKNGRQVAVETIENAMFRAACGYERTTKKYAKCKRIEYDPVTGKKVAEFEDMVEYEDTVYYTPDITAGIFLLKNWGNYMNEPRAMEFRKKELELKEKQVEANLW